MEVLEKIQPARTDSYRIVFLNGFLASRQPTAMIATPHAEDRVILRLSPPGGRGDTLTLVDAGSLFPGYTLKVPKKHLRPLAAQSAAEIRVYIPLHKTPSGLQAQFQTPMLVNEVNHRALQLDDPSLKGDLCGH
jgi:flagellar assembly factor FliW